MLWLCLLQDLGAESIEERERAVRELIEREDERPARQALTSPDPEVRARAAEALEAIQWIKLERGLPAFLAEQELPPDDFHHVPCELRGTRIYRTGLGWHSRLLALRLDARIRLSEPFAEGEQTFAVDVLRDRRARSDVERVALARTCVALLSLFDLVGSSSPAACLAWTEPIPTELGVWWGGATHRSPGFRATFAPDGRLLSADFWYRD